MFAFFTCLLFDAFFGTEQNLVLVVLNRSEYVLLAIKSQLAVRSPMIKQYKNTV